MELKTRVTNIFNSINNILAFLGATLLIYIMLATVADIIIRNFLNISAIWLVEVTTYALLYVPFLGAAWLLKRQGHVKMDVVLSQFKPKTQAMINIITSVIGTITLLVITWYSADVTWYTFRNGITLATWLRPPKWLLLVVIPIGSFLFSIQLLRTTYGYFTRWKTL